LNRRCVSRRRRVARAGFEGDLSFAGAEAGGAALQPDHIGRKFVAVVFVVEARQAIDNEGDNKYENQTQQQPNLCIRCHKKTPFFLSGYGSAATEHTFLFSHREHREFIVFISMLSVTSVAKNICDLCGTLRQAR
jgi:hypothetical protein